MGFRSFEVEINMKGRRNLIIFVIRLNLMKKDQGVIFKKVFKLN